MSTPQDQAHVLAGKLSQMLGEVMVHHAPHTAEVNETVKGEHRTLFMDAMEQHTAKQVGPFLEKILATGQVPDVFRHLLEEAIDPPAAFSAILEQIFLYGIVSNIIGTSVGPFVQGVANELNKAAVATGIAKPTDPATIATAVGRGLNLGDPPTVTVPGWAYDQAAQNGISKADTDLMASLIGLPPALQELFELQRRGIIDTDRVKQGLKEGDFRDDWVDEAIQLAHGWLTPDDFVRAGVQTQMSYADAQEWAGKTGLDVSTPVPIDTGGTEAEPNMFGLAYSIAGRPPGPEELARAANRGDIPWTGSGAGVLSFQQGIAESDVKTKWTGLLQKLAVYVPPPDSVGSLLERGAITKDQAVGYWEAGGVPTALANGYAYVASQQHIGQDKLLAIGQVKTGYQDGIFSHDEAVGMLGELGYRDEVAVEVLAIIDFRREIQAINAVIRRISSQYTAYKLTATRAQAALVKVGMPADQAAKILATWEVLREQPIRVPSPTEIGGAVKYGTITQTQGIAELTSLGYEARDAAIVLSAHAEGQVKPLPDAGDGIAG
jgi:hypothetical protein